MKSIFFGTPEFSLQTLEALHATTQIVGVVCQPDRQSGRGLAWSPPPVKVRAIELGLPVVQPTKLRTGEFGQWVRNQAADIAVVIAYGRILPEDVLSGPRFGCVNVHASILPKYRGAAPITWAVVNGETETGVTLMQMDAGLDTGDILEVFRTPIDADEQASAVSARLAELGATAIRTGLPKLFRGEYRPVKQDHNLATLAPILKKEDGAVRFEAPAKRVHDHIRGMNDWPGAHTVHRGKVLKIKRAQVIPNAASESQPGTVLLADKTGVWVACGEGVVGLLSVQLEGKKAITASEWVNGRGVEARERLGA